MKQQSFLRRVMITVRVAGLAGIFATAACNKPSPESCRKAILNIQTLLGTDKSLGNFDLEGEVRRCRGGSTRKNVACASDATSIEQLRKCDGWQSATYRGAMGGSADAVMSGSATATGSGSNAGSATPTLDAGPASGSAAGSAAAGSAAGSATGAGSTAMPNSGSAAAPK